MADATILKKVSPEARDRLSQAAREMQADEDDLIAFVVENAFAPTIVLDDEEEELTRQAIAEADAGGPFVPQAEVLKWLKSRSEGKRDPAPEATVYLS